MRSVVGCCAAPVLSLLLSLGLAEASSNGKEYESLSGEGLGCSVVIKKLREVSNIILEDQAFKEMYDRHQAQAPLTGIRKYWAQYPVKNYAYYNDPDGTSDTEPCGTAVYAFSFDGPLGTGGTIYAIVKEVPYVRLSGQPEIPELERQADPMIVDKVIRVTDGKLKSVHRGE